ncbi:hypothetical protein EV127DRAFT_481190 [Xylaria flabelliformis]|nr:hypothetical protein EV127DRAFT_481190 [Xylaria flabelliformis]
MADPLSIAGLVTSVVSLGLQVVGGLSDYLNAVKARAEDLSSANQQATNMKDLLLTIQDLLPQIKTSWPTSATLLERHIQSCNTEISALYTMVSELSQPASSSSGIRLKLAEQKQKLTYPFNRNHLSNLEERLVKVNSALQTALQVAGLDVSITTRNKLRQVHGYSVTTSNYLQHIHDASIITRDELQQVHDVSTTIRNQVQQIHDVSVTTRDEIRQMRDELRAMCQSTTLRTQSTVASLSLTAGESSDRIAKGGVGVPLDSLEAAASLASKPSLLSTSIETIVKCDTLLSPFGNRSSICLCRPSHRISHYRKTWHHFSFSHGTLNTRRHLPSCPLSRIDGEKRDTNFTIEYHGLKNLLKKAFVLSFVDSHGAGGRSIGPSFAYYPIVNEVTAPAFRIMRLARNMVYFGWKSDDDVVKVLRHCYDNVSILYSSGKACPRDVNSYGESIIHTIVDNIINAPPGHWNDFLAEITFSEINNLITRGLPVSGYNRHGSTACGYLLQMGWGPSSTKLAKLLIPNASEVPVRRTGSDSFGVYGSVCIWSLSEDLKLAEATGCGSLSLAALAGDERLVQEILRRYPESLEEVNDFGHTPLHLAISHPTCLRLILEAGGSSILEKRDVKNLTPLYYACYSSYRESVLLLLASGSRIESVIIEGCDESCINDVFIALLQRRGELKRLALDNLTETEAESLRLHDNTVLNSKVDKVLELLQGRGVNIPSHLYDEVKVYHRNNYCRANYRNIFDQLWALGFRDIDGFDHLGQLPVTTHYDPDALRWLIEHGADYWTLYNERSGSVKITDSVTPAHFMLAGIGSQLNSGRISPGSLETFQWLVEKLLRVRVSDACSCLCFVGGCKPLKSFWDGWMSLPDFFSSYTRTLEDQTRMCVDFIKAFQTCLRQDDLALLVRRLTFDSMELRHTCCCISFIARPYRRRRYKSEEIDEINSEQSTLLILFADLMSYFEEVAFNDQGGMPLIASDPEEFWIHRWLPRITETLESLNGSDLTPEEKSAAEAIGVVWGPHPVRTTACEKVYRRDYTPEYVMREMEKIMNE